jgi:uncharacterized protein
MHARPLRDGPPYLLVGNSARALARSAARGGYDVHVLDGFADADTALWARSVTRLPWGHGQEIDRVPPEVVEIARSLGPFQGLVYAAGFESAPYLLNSLSQIWPLSGNSASLVARVKDPEGLSALLQALHIPHPESRRTRPADARHWLCKRIGGAGGGHVRAAEAVGTLGDDEYFQRHVDGRSISALFLANGRRAAVVGFHEQWVNGDADNGFYAYGGACSAHGLSPAMRAAMRAAIERLVAAVGLRGLNGVDFVVEQGAFTLIEINPRPCITLDLYDPDWDEGLFHWHLQACAGRLPGRLPVPGRVRAHRVLYAAHKAVIPAGAIWPDWVTDRPAGPQEVPRGMPVCTIHAEAARTGEARPLLDHRTAWLKRCLEVSGTSPYIHVEHEVV